MSGLNSNQVENKINHEWQSEESETGLPLNQEPNQKSEAATLKLRQALIGLNEQKNQAEIEAIRAEIISLSQEAASVKNHLAIETSEAIEKAAELTNHNNRLNLKNTLGWTTINAYDLFIKKANKQKENQSSSSKKSNLLSPIGQILRFNNSSGEDDTNQKAG